MNRLLMSYPRTVDNMLRVQLCGGMRTVLRLFADVEAVRFHGEHGDTTPVEEVRVASTAYAREGSVDSGCTETDGPVGGDQYAKHVDMLKYWSQQWYLLTVGAAVDKALTRGRVLIERLKVGRTSRRSAWWFE